MKFESPETPQAHERRKAARQPRFWTRAAFALGLLLSLSFAMAAHADPDLLVELPLDAGSGTVAADVSGNGNDGALFGGAVYDANTGDGSTFALRLDGVDDYIDLDVLDVVGAGLTLSTWFNADSYPGSARDPRLISKATGTASNAHVFMLGTIKVGSATRLRARVRVGGTTTTLIASSGDLVIGEWHHAAATYDGSRLRLYLDAIEVGSTSLSGAVDVDASIPVAVGAQPPGAGGKYFPGLMDDVRIYQRGLSAAEIAGLIVTSGNPIASNDGYATLVDTVLVVDAPSGVLSNDTDPEMDPLSAILVDDVSNGALTLDPNGSFSYSPTAGFVGQDTFTYLANDSVLNSNLATVTIDVSAVSSSDAFVELPLDAGSGMVAVDASGNGNDGALLGGAVYEANTGDGSAYALRLDGVDDYVDLGVLDVVGAGLTLSTWFNADSYPGSARDPRLISKATGTAANAHVFMLGTIKVGSATRLRARVRVGGTTTTLIASSGDLVIGEWHHAAATYDGSVLRLYLDANEVGSTSLSGPVDVDASIPVVVGAQPPGAGGKYFPGLMDDVRIYQRGLSSTEVAELVGMPPTGSDTTPPTAPSEVVAVPLSETSVEIGWSDAVDDVAMGTYSVFRDGAEIASGLTATQYVDSVLISGTSYGYTIVARDLAGNVAPASAVATAQTLAVGAPTWFDPTLGFRIPIDVDANGTVRADRYLEVTLDLTAALASAGESAALDLNSLRVVRANSIGQVLDPNVDFQFDPVAGFDPGTNAVGDLVVRMAGTALDTDQRRYDLYFEVVGESFTPVAVADRVSVSNTVDEGQDALQIDTAASSYFFQEQGASLSSLVDADGDDWIGYRIGGGSAGDFRGIPNLIFPESEFHPGGTTGLTTVESSGPLRLTVKTTALSNTWEATWSFYDDHVSMTVERIDHNYWFLYEGTPGGLLETGSDFVTRSDGTQTLLSESWNQDIAGEEWVFFGDPGAGRSLFLASHEDDAISDSYRTLNGEMTVFGFGRSGTSTLLNAAPKTFSLGLIESLDFDVNARRIRSITQDLGVVVNAIDVEDGSGPSGNPIASNDGYATLVDTVLVVDAASGVLSNDTDPEMDVLSAILVDDVSNGVLTLDPNGSFSYSPDPGFVGQDTFTYLANDSALNSNLATVTIDVSAVSSSDAFVELPLDAGSGTVAVDASGNRNDGALLGGAVYEANTGDGSAYALRLDGVDDYVDLGVLDVVGAGLTLSTWFNADSYPGSARDPRLISKATGTAANAHVFMLGTIKVGSATRLRARVRVGGTTTTLIASSGDLVIGEWHHAAATYDGSVLRLYLDANEVGSTSLSGPVDVDASIPVVVGAQPPGAGGKYFPGLMDDVRIYERGLSPAEITGLAASSSNPIANDDGYATVVDTVLVVDAASGVLSNDTDPESDVLSAILVDDVSSGNLSLNSDGSFVYDPAPGFVGQVGFTYQASDGTLLSNIASVSIDVSADAPPIANGDGYMTDEDTALVVPVLSGVLANDQDQTLPDDLTALLFSGPTNGTLTNLGADGSFAYTPSSNFSGGDSFMYEAVDGGTGLRASATVILTVTEVNDAPIAGDDGYQTPPDTALVIDASGGVLANDSDPELDTLDAILVDDVSNGSLTLSLDGAFQYNPTTGFTGSDEFTYRANDSVLDSNLATVTISVGGENSQPRIVTGEPDFTKQIIDNTVDETHAVVAADFTGDGEIDLAATDFVDGMLFWYENDGNGGFINRVLDSNLDGAYPASVGDVDGDGDTDVLAAGYDADTFVWYESDGAGGFTRYDIDTASDGAHSIVTDDMDGDGDMDLLTSSQDSNTIAWYENDGALSFTLRVIDTTAAGAKRAEFADLDGDGDMDVVTASFFDDTIAWYANDGSQNFTKQVIDDTANGAYFVTPADVDGDGDLDVFSASQNDNTVAWYRNDEGSGFSAQTITADANAVRRVAAADIDGDGDIDALSSNKNDDTIAWYANDGSGSFSAAIVDSDAPGAYGLFVIDINDDDQLDILSASRDSGEIAIHRQRTTHLLAIGLGDSVTIDSTLLLTTDPDDGPSELTYTITVPPDFGVLALSGLSLGVGSSFTQEDVDLGRLSYTHDGVDQSDDGFEFSVADGGEGGVQPLMSRFVIDVAGFSGSLVELPLDEGSGATAGDVSGNGFDGALINGAAFEADSGDGSAYSVRFDGLDDLIDLGEVDPNGTGLTVAAWFKADSFPGPSNDPRLISKATGLAANDHIFMLGTISAGAEVRLRARVRHNGATQTLIAATGNVAIGAWYHAALIADGSSLRLFLNGVEVGSALSFGAVDYVPAVPVAVGAQPIGAGGRFFDGLIDDVRILSRAMSAAEISAIAAGGN